MTLYEEIKERARKYTEETYRNPTSLDYMVVENAMLLGSTLTIKHVGESLIGSQNDLVEAKRNERNT